MSEGEKICLKVKIPKKLQLVRDPDAKFGFCYFNNLYKDACAMKGKCDYTGVDVYYPFKDAVVTVRSFFTILVDNEEQQFSNEGTGFLMLFESKDGCSKKYVIVTASNIVMTSQTRVPAAPNAGFAKANNILVEINNVNGEGKSYIYLAYLMGVDGVGNIAVLGINFGGPENVQECTTPCGKACGNRCDRENNGVPVLSTQVHLEWGRSRDYPTGRPAYTITAPTAANSNCVVIGYVRNNHYNPEDSSIQFESVDFNEELDLSNSGAPLISDKGLVIGDITQFVVNQELFVGSVSEYYARNVVSAIVTGQCGYWSSFLETIPDTLGSYFRYSKGWYGISWSLYTSQDFYDLSQYNAANFLPPITFRQLLGVLVTGVDVMSPLRDTFQPLILAGNNILITSINFDKVGGTPPQIIPSDISHFSVPGLPFVMSYRLSNEGFTIKHRVCSFFGFFPYALDLVGNNIC